MSNIDTNKVILFWLIASFFVFITLFCQAATYTSTQSGNWEDGSTWVGGTAPTSLTTDDVIEILAAHDVTYSGLTDYMVNKVIINVYGTFSATGDFDGKNNLTINVYDEGTIDINNFIAGSDANITINVNGAGTISSNMTLGSNATLTLNGSLTVEGSIIATNGANFTVDGILTVKQNISVGNNSNLYGTGIVELTGECDGGGSNFCNMGPLPVDLLYFQATQANNNVMLEWSTASELNNDFFTLERSRNGVKFDAVATMKGKGTVSTSNDYWFVDSDPFLGISYYRLSQTDYDGTTEYFPMTSVFYRPDNKSFSVYPNPMKDGTIQLRSSSKLKHEPITLRITNLQGKLIMEQLLVADAFGNIDHEIDIQDLRLNNTYIVELISKSGKETIKMLGN